MDVEILGKVRSVGDWKKEPEDHRDYKLAALPPADLPVKVDLEFKCPPTEDQSVIGSCTANAGSSAVEFVNSTSLSLSRLFLYYATRVWIAGEMPTDDNGAYIRDVMKALATYGVCTEFIMPYDLQKWQDAPSEKAVAEAFTRKILQYWRCDGLAAIKTCLAQGFPLEGGFLVPENMLSEYCERTGIIKEFSPGEQNIGGHAVLFVGYDDTTKLLKFQNSWSSDWGINGFGFLPYSFVTEGLADDFWTIRTVETGVLPVPTPKPKPLSWWERFLRWLRGAG